MRLSGSRSAQTDAAQRRWEGGRGGDEGARRGGREGATYASEAEVGGLNYERQSTTFATAAALNHPCDD